MCLDAHFTEKKAHVQSLDRKHRAHVQISFGKRVCLWRAFFMRKRQGIDWTKSIDAAFLFGRTQKRRQTTSSARLIVKKNARTQVLPLSLSPLSLLRPLSLLFTPSSQGWMQTHRNATL